MTTLKSTLQAIAQKRHRPWDEVLTDYLLEGVLRRVAASPYVSDFVLRGGMLTRLWVSIGQRIAVDVDFLGLYPFSISATEQRFREILTADGFADGITFDLAALEAKGIWLDTLFPGVRICLPAAVEHHQQQVQIDVGFGDPIVPPAEWINYPALIPTMPVMLQAVQPETMAAWKLHGLIEQGAKRWRAKDLYDLMLFATIVPLKTALLPNAIQAAFSSRNADLQEVRQILTNSQWWNTGKHRRHWRWYCRKAPAQHTPDDFLSVVTSVMGYWGPIVDSLCVGGYDQR